MSVLELGVRSDNASLDGLRKNALLVEAGAIVGDLDHHISTLMVGREADRSFGRLSFGDTVVRHFNAVIDRVANHVHERIAKLFDNGAIHFRFLPRNHKLDLLLNTGGEVAYQAVHFLECGLNGNHAKRHGDLLKLKSNLA